MADEEAKTEHSLQDETPFVACKLQYPIEENPFESLAADLTYRCNMECRYCYNPVRSFPDMELDYFEEACRRLPAPVTFKFLGGEPTLHPDLFEFMRAAARHGHQIIILSNGMRYTEIDFVKALADLDIPYCLGISLDGGHSRRDVYRAINNSDCLEWKMRALDTLEKHWSGRLCISAIIVRDLNEGVIPELLEIAERYRRIVRYIHIRTAGRAGRYDETTPYALEELKELVCADFTDEQFSPRCVWEIHCPPETGCGGCYRFRPSHRLQISLIETITPRALTCHKRGKLIDREFVVQSMFENIVRTNDALTDTDGT